MFSNPGDDGGDDDGGDDGKTCTDNHSRCPEWANRNPSECEKNVSTRQAFLGPVKVNTVIKRQLSLN